MLRSLVLDHLEVVYPTFHQIYTDGYVHRDLSSSTAAFTIPALEADWSARLERAFSSTAAEIVAINEAWRFTLSLTFSKPLLILTDSHCAIQRITSPCPVDAVIASIREYVIKIDQASKSVTIQWILSHAGLPGNERADKLANDAFSICNYSGS